MKYLAPVSALVMACGLLALQIVGGLEYTEGASLYTRASMIGAMVSVAALPLMIEAALSRKAWLSAIIMGVAAAAFLAYSLPATTGRTGEVKEAKAAPVAKALEDKARVQADYEKTRKLVDESNAWQPKACAGGNGNDCKSATFVLNQRQASLEKLAKQLEAFQAPPPGDLGSDLWAGVIGVEASTVRQGSIIAFALGLEAGIFGLVLFGARSIRSITETAPGQITDEDIEEFKRATSNDTEPLPPTKAIVPEPTGSNIVPWAQAFRAEHNRLPEWPEVKAAFPEVSKTTAWRRVKAA